MDGDLAVFDLDGTLVDTAPDLIDTCNTVLSRRGIPAVAPQTLRHFIGRGARAMIEASLEASGIALSEGDLEAVHAEYLEHYAGRIAELSRPFPEILRALDTLEAAGVGLGVCTNKKESLARLLLRELGLAHRFATITGADTFGASKPDPEPLLRTIAAAGATVARTVFVGDSRIDHETARAAGVPIVGLDYGYTDVPLAELGPDRLLSRGDDIAAAILALLEAQTPRVAAARR
jgi:phosphoglycolate phosphatase